MAIHYSYSEEHTGLIDKNGMAITDNCWLECDDGYYKTRAYHYVFWDDDCLCWSTIRFCPTNPKLDWKEELFRVKHRNPIVIERPNWVTDDRMIAQLKYHNSAWAEKFKVSITNLSNEAQNQGQLHKPVVVRGGGKYVLSVDDGSGVIKNTEYEATPNTPTEPLDSEVWTKGPCAGKCYFKQTDWNEQTCQCCGYKVPVE